MGLVHLLPPEIREDIQSSTSVLGQPVDLAVRWMPLGNEFSLISLYMVDGFRPVKPQTSLIR